jgi:hypothetical protein
MDPFSIYNRITGEFVNELYQMESLREALGLLTNPSLNDACKDFLLQHLAMGCFSNAESSQKECSELKGRVSKDAEKLNKLHLWNMYLSGRFELAETTITEQGLKIVEQTSKIDLLERKIKVAFYQETFNKAHLRADAICKGTGGTAIGLTLIPVIGLVTLVSLSIPCFVFASKRDKIASAWRTFNTLIEQGDDPRASFWQACGSHKVDDDDLNIDEDVKRGVWRHPYSD